MKYTIQRLSIQRTSLTLGLVYLVLSLFLLPLFLWAASRNPQRPLPGVGQMLLFPVIYAVAAYVVTALVCLIYNWVAHLTGGIALELREEPPSLEPGTKP